MECKKYYIAVCNVVRERTEYGITSKNYRITIFYVLIYYIYVNTNYPGCPLYPTQHPLSTSPEVPWDVGGFEWLHRWLASHRTSGDVLSISKTESAIG